MKRFSPLALSLALAACVGGGNGGGSTTSPIPIAAHAAPNGQPSTCQNVIDLSNALGFKIGDATYPGLVWPKAELTRLTQCDKANGFPIIIKLAPRNGAAVVPLANIVAGNVDTQLKAEAAAVAALGVPVLIDNLYEPTTQIYEKLANPKLDPNLYVQAWNHIAAIFNSPNVTLAWTADSTLFSGNWQAWNPGGQAVTGEDDYTLSDAPAVCSLAQPYAIMEFGAVGSNQSGRIAQVAAACPKANPLLYFDAVGTSGDDYVLTPQGIAALEAVGK